MADDRPVEDTTDQLARVTSELNDLKSTVLARLSARPTGDIEPTIRSTAKAGTLLMQGQSVAKASFPVLWQWVQDQGLLVAGLFSQVGNNFTLPDFRGRVPVGAGTPPGGTNLAVGALVGADFLSLAANQMPTHNHGAAGSHDHGGGTTHDYGHTGHFPGSSVIAAGGSTWGVAAWNSEGNYNIPHVHDLNTDNGGSHTHFSNGSGDPFDNRQSSIAINWLIYT